MDYYARKQKANMRIDGIIKKNSKITFNSLVLIIGSEFGLDDRFIKKRLAILEKEGNNVPKDE